MTVDVGWTKGHEYKPCRSCGGIHVVIETEPHNGREYVVVRCYGCQNKRTSYYRNKKMVPQGGS